MRSMPFIIVVIIMIHHYYKHKNDKQLTFFEKFFQISDIKNHESWILFFIGISIGMNLFN